METARAEQNFSQRVINGDTSALVPLEVMFLSGPTGLNVSGALATKLLSASLNQDGPLGISFRQHFIIQNGNQTSLPFEFDALFRTDPNTELGQKFYDIVARSRTTVSQAEIQANRYLEIGLDGQLYGHEDLVNGALARITDQANAKLQRDVAEMSELIKPHVQVAFNYTIPTLIYDHPKVTTPAEPYILPSFAKLDGIQTRNNGQRISPLDVFARAMLSVQTIIAGTPSMDAATANYVANAIELVVQNVQNNTGQIINLADLFGKNQLPPSSPPSSPPHQDPQPPNPEPFNGLSGVNLHEIELVLGDIMEFLQKTFAEFYRNATTPASAEGLQSNPSVASPLNRLPDPDKDKNEPLPTPSPTPHLEGTPAKVIYLPRIVENAPSGGNSTPVNTPTLENSPTPIPAAIEVVFEKVSQVEILSSPQGGSPTAEFSADARIIFVTDPSGKVISYGDFVKVAEVTDGTHPGWVPKDSVANEPEDAAELTENQVPLVFARKLIGKVNNQNTVGDWFEKSIVGSFNPPGNHFGLKIDFGKLIGTHRVLIAGKVGQGDPWFKNTIGAEIFIEQDGSSGTIAFRDGINENSPFYDHFTPPTGGNIVIEFLNGGKQLILKDSNGNELTGLIDLNQAGLPDGLFPDGKVKKISLTSYTNSFVEINGIDLLIAANGKAAEPTPIPTNTPPKPTRKPTRKVEATPVAKVVNISIPSPSGELVGVVGAFSPDDAPNLRYRGRTAPGAGNFDRQLIKELTAPDAVFSDGNIYEELRWVAIRNITQNSASREMFITYSFKDPNSGEMITITEPLLGSPDGLLFKHEKHYTPRQIYNGIPCLLYRDKTSSAVVGCSLVPANGIHDD